MLEFAKKMELEGKIYYEKLAEESPLLMMKGVFTFLAVEEQRHIELFDAMLKNQNVSAGTDDGTLVKKVKSVFEELSVSFTLPDVIYDYQAAYGKALDFERESVRYYTDAVASADPSQREALNYIIKEEKLHVRLIESLLEFVVSPKRWLENAEWHHLDAY